MSSVARTNGSVTRSKAKVKAGVASQARLPKLDEAETWDARLGFLMHDVSRLRRSVFDEFMKPMGLTRSQWWILAHATRHDGTIQSELASVLEVGKAALGGLLDRLEASQLIERRSDSVDRRAKRIYLTTKGAQAIKSMRVMNHEINERILHGLDAEGRQALVKSLDLVKSNLLAIRDEFDNVR